MDIVPFQVEHLKRINLQSSQMDAFTRLGDAEEAYLNASQYAFTALDGDEVVACAGIVDIWQGRGQAWALMSNSIGVRFVKVHRAVKRALDLYEHRRVEMIVDADFAEGLKWAELLGFKCETPDGMPGYYNDGRLYKLFARVK